MTTKFKEFDVPSGLRNQYYSKNVNSGKINLNDKSNVKLVSNRHLSKNSLIKSNCLQKGNINKKNSHR